MTISVLIAAYNAAPFLPAALASVATQSHTNWELIVVEDGSNDGTETLTQAFATAHPNHRVTYENLGANQGVATTRNRLLALAQGDAVAFLDADDWWTPTHLTRAAAALPAGADIAVARLQLFDLAAGTPMETYAAPANLFTDPVHTLFSLSAIQTASCVVLDRDICTKAGGFDPVFRIGEDRDYWLRCAIAGARFVDTGQVSCFYAKHALSTMTKTLLWSAQEILFYEKHRNLASVPARLRRRLLADKLLNYSRLVRSSDRAASRQALQHAWRLAPLRPRILAQFLWLAKG